MFKFIKDLAEVPKSPRALASFAAQQAGTNLPGDATGAANAGTDRDRRTSATRDSDTLQPPASTQPLERTESSLTNPLDENDPGVLQVVWVVHALEGVADTMTLVETLAHLLSVPGTPSSRRTFRTHGGFARLVGTLGALAWKPRPDDVAEDEWQVEEVQRAEGQRLWFEALAWGMGDREGEAAFTDEGGYAQLLDGIRALSPPNEEKPRAPDSRVLGLLLAHLLNSNYSLLTLCNDVSTLPTDAGALEKKVGDVLLSWGAGLPLLWAYVWGLESVTDEGPNADTARDALYAGELEPAGDEPNLVLVTLRVLALAAHSLPNLFLIRGNLPQLGDFLLTRLYGWTPQRRFESTFPPRPEWYAHADAEAPAQNEADAHSRPWEEPAAPLRDTYLDLAGRLAEVGLTPEQAWRLFALVRKEPQAADSADDSGAGTPAPTPAGDSSDAPQQDSSPSKPLRGKARALRLKLPGPSPSGETLDTEVLSLLSRAMRSHAPPAFVFRGAGDAGGVQVRDLPRTFPNSTKGFIFAAWVRITRLNGPVTLLQLSQRETQHDDGESATASSEPRTPLFQIRILENSQIGILSSVPPKDKKGKGKDDTEDPEPVEVICGAPDALVPHGEWTHVAIACRKGRSTAGGGGEARIYINGRRVGAVRATYPVPRPAPKKDKNHKDSDHTHSHMHSPHSPHSPHLAHHHHPHSQHALSPHHHIATGTHLGHFKIRPPNEGIRVSVGCPWQPTPPEPTGSHGLGPEDSEWMLGRTLLLEEVVSEDIVMLMYNLGPRYHGHFQEELSKFLTYEKSSAIHIYLHGLARAASEKTFSLNLASSPLVKAIRNGPAIAEDNVLLSLSAKYALPAGDKHEHGHNGNDYVLNAAVPHSSRARDFKYGRARLVGNVFTAVGTDLDTAVVAVGGGVLVLKLVDLAQNSEELATTLTMLYDMLEQSWQASEEMERIHGFELLAAILRPKMSTMVDAHCAKIVLSLLGIDMNNPEEATVHNSAAYRALGLDFELWARAPFSVVTLFFEHFDCLLQQSKHRQYNQLVTFQKSGVVVKLLYAIRSGAFTPEAVPLAVDALRLALVGRWSIAEAIKPIFSYLVSALCQNTAPSSLLPTAEPTVAQYPAALILRMMADVLAKPARLVKLTKAVPLHRLIVIFLQSNPAPFVVYPCLAMIEHCVATPGVESFAKAFEQEGGFALLARTLAPLWSGAVQESLFRILFGPSGPSGSTLACPAVILVIMAELDMLLSAANEHDPTRANAAGASDSLSQSLSRSIGSLKSLKLTTPKAETIPLPGQADNDSDSSIDDRSLENLLERLAQVYRQSSAFRRALTARRIEAMLPNMVDFAALSASSNLPERSQRQRSAAIQWLTALIELSKATPTITNQMKLLVEQLKSSLDPAASPVPPSPKPPPSPLLRTPSLLSPSTSSFPRLPFSPLTPTTPTSSFRKQVPLRRTLTGESVLQDEQDKNAAWRMIIISTDAQKHAAMTLDRKEHWQRVSQVEWPQQVAALRAENGVWADKNPQVTWRLDGSEGPLRMRNRLERVEARVENSSQGRGSRKQRLRDAIPTADELSSAISRMDHAPWEDPFSLALGDAEPIAEEGSSSQPASRPTSPKAQALEIGEGSDDGSSYAEVEDDKLRLVAKALQAGDVVEEAHNIVRIVGVDALPGLLILGRRNLYLIDGLVKTEDGRVVEADQAPQDVLSIPSGTLADLEGDQRSHRWPYADVVESNKRAFLFRDVALELYFADKQNFLIVFRDKRQRTAVMSKLSAKLDAREGLSRSLLGSLLLDTVARAMDSRAAALEDLTRRWQSREISNFAYLQLLNQHANRTPNDVTQYPVFPWVVADYTSDTLDLSAPGTFRDLSFPMGALTPARREAAVERYQATEGVGETPFHYGTHYSSSMIVCGFMIRLSPFTEIFLALQGGNFDLADRLFSSIPRTWDSASNANRGDVRELIPEFYYTPTFLLNVNHHDFGKKQVSGDSVDDVALPPWALGDPMLFVHWHREALESDYVSRHLPAWIDLTFGYKQRDPASYNCFHPLSYRGAVDLDHMEDEGEKAASTAIIHNFGQTPVQIFKTSHPPRAMGGRMTLPTGHRFGVAEHWQVLLRSALPISESPPPVHHILDPPSPDSRPYGQRQHRLAVPNHHSLSLQFGFADYSLRIYHQDSAGYQRMVHIVEGIDAAHAVFASPTLLITVSPRGVLTAWRLTVRGNANRRQDVGLAREAILRGHCGPVSAVAVSTAWSLLVTGAEDGTAMVWDMNRLRYTRTLVTPRRERIEYIAVNESDGHIALASEHYLYMFSLNGHPIASTSVVDKAPEISIGAPASPSTPPRFTGGIAFLKREHLKWGNLIVVGVGSGLALYRCVPGVRRWDHETEPWRLVKQGMLHRSDECGGDVTAVRFIGETLYAAFTPPAHSRRTPLYQWTLPDGPVPRVPEPSVCMSDGCKRSFGLLEPRRWCGGCGGAFCSGHGIQVDGFRERYCDRCRVQLALANAAGVLDRHSVPGSLAVSRAASRAVSRVGSRRPSVVFGDEAEQAAARAAAAKSAQERLRDEAKTIAGKLERAKERREAEHDVESGGHGA